MTNRSLRLYNFAPHKTKFNVICWKRATAGWLLTYRNRIYWLNASYGRTGSCVFVFSIWSIKSSPLVGKDPISSTPPSHTIGSHTHHILPRPPPSNPFLSAKSEINSFLNGHLRIFRQSQLLIDCYSKFKFWFHLHNESVQGLMGGKRNTDVDSFTIWHAQNLHFGQGWSMRF